MNFEKSRLAIWLIVAIIITVVLVVAALAILGSKYSAEKSPLSSEEKAREKVLPEKEKHSEIFSYVGKIKEIKPDKIIFLAPAFTNYGLGKDTEMTVLIDKNTKFYKIEKPNVLPSDLKPGKGGSLFKRTEISLSGLKVGERVTVVSATNIRSKTEFVAKKIEVSKVK